MPKLVWRVKLVAEFEAGETTEVEVARLERDEQAGLADLGLRLAEAKQLMAAIQAEIVPVQVTIASEHRRTCLACERALASKGHYSATFRSLFGDVPIRVRRLLTCPCQEMAEARSFAAFDLEAGACKSVGFITLRMRLACWRLPGGSRDSDDGSSRPAYRSARLSGRRGRAAPSPCSNASQASPHFYLMIPMY